MAGTSQLDGQWGYRRLVLRLEAADGRAADVFADAERNLGLPDLIEYAGRRFAFHRATDAPTGGRQPIPVYRQKEP